MAAAFGVGLWLVARGVNRPPVVLGLHLEPAEVVAGGDVRVRVAAEDPDGDPLTFAFQAEHGRVGRGSPSAIGEAHYRAAVDGPVHDRVTVTVTDARGLASTASGAITIRSAGPTPSPAPTAPSTLAAPTVASAGAPSRSPASPVARAAVQTPAGRPAPRPFNRAPVLQGGTNFFGIEGGGLVGLAATGHDPDGDPITHRWELGPCVTAVTSSHEQADVKLAEGCESANVSLVWTDVHGASARTEWNLLR